MLIDVRPHRVMSSYLYAEFRDTIRRFAASDHKDEVRVPAMESFDELATRNLRHAPLPAEGGLRALGFFLGAVGERISMWLTEANRALESENMYAQLRHMSDDDLAKIGLRREEIAQFIKKRMY